MNRMFLAVPAAMCPLALDDTCRLLPSMPMRYTPCVRAGKSVFIENRELTTTFAILKYGPWLCGDSFKNTVDPLSDHSVDIGCLDNCSEYAPHMVSNLRWLNNALHNKCRTLQQSGRGAFLSNNRDDHTLYVKQASLRVTFQVVVEPRPHPHLTSPYDAGSSRRGL